jgi:hypothetical protein
MINFPDTPVFGAIRRIHYENGDNGAQAGK